MVGLEVVDDVVVSTLKRVLERTLQESQATYTHKHKLEGRQRADDKINRVINSKLCLAYMV
jgi:hypothetical protein